MWCCKCDCQGIRRLRGLSVSGRFVCSCARRTPVRNEQEERVGIAKQEAGRADEEVMLVFETRKSTIDETLLVLGPAALAHAQLVTWVVSPPTNNTARYCSITTLYAIVPTLSSPFLLLFVAHHARRAPSDPAGSQKRPPFFVHHRHHVGETTL